MFKRKESDVISSALNIGTPGVKNVCQFSQKTENSKSQTRFRNSPDVQPGRFCHCWRVIIRPRRLCRDSCGNGPQLQGVSTEVLAKAENLGADALQLGTISMFDWITSL
jgi:hypothetical protein